jgi:hypothetical protein
MLVASNMRMGKAQTEHLAFAKANERSDFQFVKETL